MTTILGTNFKAVNPIQGVKNVFDVVSIAANPFSKDKITTPIENKILKAGIEATANNPYTTAGVIVGGPTILTKAGAAFSTLKTLTKVLASTAALAFSGAVVGNPKLAAPSIQAAGMITPEAIVKYGSTASQVKNPTDLVNLAKQNPVLTAATAGVTAYFGGKLVNTGINALNAYETRQNTEATRKNTNINNLPSTGSTPKTIEKQKDADIDVIKAQSKAQESLLKSQADLQASVFKVQSKSQIDIIEAQTKAAKELAKVQQKSQADEIIRLNKLVESQTPTTLTTTPMAVVKPKSKKKSKKKKKKVTKKKKRKVNKHKRKRK